jgi:hypothetical protein
MISDEYMLKAAGRMQDAAQTSSAAADRMEQAAQRLACIFEDGYGGNALRLIELLDNHNAAMLNALTAIKELIIKGDYSDERALELIAEGVAGKP